jgi:hypothetical protein
MKIYLVQVLQEFFSEYGLMNIPGITVLCQSYRLTADCNSSDAFLIAANEFRYGIQSLQ